MERIEITESELIQALLAASGPPDDSNPHNAKTKRELRELTGRSETWIYDRLQALKREGRLGVTQLMREAVNGVIRPISAYYLKGEVDGDAEGAA